MSTEALETAVGSQEVAAAVEAPQVAVDKPVEEVSGSAAAPEKPAYNPNFTYKVSGQEKQFDDWLKSAIKDQETEKKARELYTRAEGLESVKHHRDRLETEISTLQEERQSFAGEVERLNHLVQSDDLQSFFDSWRIPKEQVLRYALREIQFSENPALRQEYEQRRQENLNLYQNQIQGKQVMSQYEQAAVSLRERELDFAMKQPETLSVVEQFDTRAGRPGAFRDELINRGRFHFHTQGIDMPVDQLIKEVTQLFGLSQAQAPQVSAGGGNGVVQGSKGKPVIPNIPGSGQSAVKKQIKGIAGLKEKYKELTA